MYNMYSSSSDTSESDDWDIVELTTLDLSKKTLNSAQLEDKLKTASDPPGSNAKIFKAILLSNNIIEIISPKISKFLSLKYLDMSSNAVQKLPPELCLCPLKTLIAKNNRLNEKSLPPNFNNMTELVELNLSGNNFTRFPSEILELDNIKFLYIGGNKISEIPEGIKELQSLQVFSIGGNLLTEIPSSLGQLHKLKALILSDNKIQVLPQEIANLTNLKSLLLHRNELKTLPTEIITLKNLNELSLRDNPLVVRFVSDMSNIVPSLFELSARHIKSGPMIYSMKELPRCLVDYLDSAHRCVNPKCKGVYFDSRVEHVKFVDFCGKYRVPLMQYLCSAKCIDDNEDIVVDSGLMRKVLLG